MENDKIIKLLKSSNREDVILGFNFLNKKSPLDWEYIMDKLGEGSGSGYRFFEVAKGLNCYYGRKKQGKRLLINRANIYLLHNYKRDTVRMWKSRSYKPL